MLMAFLSFTLGNWDLTCWAKSLKLGLSSFTLVSSNVKVTCFEHV